MPYGHVKKEERTQRAGRTAGFMEPRREKARRSGPEDVGLARLCAECRARLRRHDERADAVMEERQVVRSL